MRSVTRGKLSVKLAVATMTAAIITLALVIGSMTRSASAAGAGGGFAISPDGSIVAAVPGVFDVSEPAGTCSPDGASGNITCQFTTAPHSGGAIVRKGVVECFVIQPDGGSFNSFDSDFVYAPSGQVTIRCNAA